MQIERFTRRGEIARNATTHLIRATDEHGESVLLRIPAPDVARDRALADLRREWSLTADLEGHSVLLPRQLLEQPPSVALVYPDPGVRGLGERLLDGPLAVHEALAVFSALASALDRFHGSGWVHGRIEPGSILLGDDGRVWLTNLGRALATDREPSIPDAPPVSERLAWIAPEQTGRLGREVDRRADLYGVGVLLFQALAGRLPFEAHDALGWIHGHIARRPPELAALDAHIPLGISRIVSRLLAKQVDGRYRSARGLHHDLGRAADRLRAGDADAEFPLGERDADGHIHPPARFHGRREEAARLVRQLAAAADGPPTLTAVAGAAGIGKTALLRHVRDGLDQPTRWIDGKCDPLTRHTPFDVLAQAVRALVRGWLGQDEATLVGWRRALLAAVHPNGQLLVELVPELGELLGPQPDVPALPSMESRNRLEEVFLRLLQASARAGHPLAMVLDDLHWADRATLRLLGALLASPDTRHLAVVFSYRPTEVDDDHPIQGLLAHPIVTADRVDQLHLERLAPEASVAVVADALADAPARLAPLARIADERSDGNPILLVEFLRAAVRGRALWFDATAGQWVWEESRARTLAFGSDALEAIGTRLAALPDEVREVVEVAACLGGRFERTTLARVCALPVERVETAIAEAIAHGLFTPLPRGDTGAADGDDEPGTEDTPAPSLRFVHDRVQEAADHALSAARRAATHRAAATVIADTLPDDDRGERLFAAVHHARRAQLDDAPPEERLRFATLAARAGQQAFRSGDASGAVGILRDGLALLGDAPWQLDAELALELHVLGADAEYLAGDGERGDTLVERALAQTADPMDAVPLHRLRIARFNNALRLPESVAEGLALLRKLGMDIDADAEAADPAGAGARIHEALAGRGLDCLRTLPPIDDPRAHAMLSALCAVIPAATMARPALAPALYARGLELVLRHGICAEAGAVCNSQGILLCAIGEVEQGYALGEIAMELARRYADDPAAFIVPLQFPVFIQHRREPLRATLTPLERGAERSLQAGDAVTYGYCVNQHYAHMVLAGEPLTTVAARTDGYRDQLRLRGQHLSGQTLAIYGQFVDNLRGGTETPWQLSGPRFDLEHGLAELKQTNTLMAQFFVHNLRLWLAVLFGRHDEARACAADAAATVAGAPSMAPVGLFHANAALADLASAGELDEDARAERVAAAEPHVAAVREWARHAPADHAPRAALLDAELARLDGRFDDALRSYDEAIRGADNAGLPFDAGLVAERAAGLLDSRGLPAAAAGMLHQARAAYRRWGALAKVRAIDEALGITAPADDPDEEPTPTDAVDVDTLLQMSRTLNAEIGLDQVLDRLIGLAIRNAGAERGALLLVDADEPRLVARGSGTAVEILLPDGIPLSRCEDLPHTAVRLVCRTRRTLVLEDARHAEVLRDDPAVDADGPVSVLCIPLEHRGSLTGVLYLQNDLVPGAFSRPRVALLETLSSLAAISVDNARLVDGLARAGVELRASHERLEQHSRDLEAAVRERTEELERLHSDRALLLGAMVEGICGLDERGRITFVNPAVSHITGWSSAELLGRDLHDTLHDPDGQLAVPCPMCHGPLSDRAGDAGAPTEEELRHRNGAVVPVEALRRPIRADDGTLRGAVVTLRDITVRRELQGQLEHAQRMEALGRFAGGVAHDFNNLLTPILGGVELLRTGPMADPHEERVLHNIGRAARRAADLVHQLLAFGRRSPVFLKSTDMNAVLDEVAEFLRHSLDRSIELVVERADGPAWVRGDAGQLHQVLLNLGLNARDAVMARTAGEGRQVTLSLRIVELLDDELTDDATTPPGSYVEVSVRDNGPGMERETAARIFQPFFTTKEIGQGSGLGLSVVYGIVRGHHGTIDCLTAPGEGATLRVRLPEAAPAGEAQRSTGTIPAIDDSIGARVLVVDDEPAVREMATAMLTRLGHRVIEAGDGATALDRYRREGATIDVVLLDLSMPGMDGEQVLEELLKIDPAAQVVLCSGYAAGPRLEGVSSSGARAFLAKPFRLEQLDDALQTALDGPPAELRTPGTP